MKWSLKVEAFETAGGVWLLSDFLRGKIEKQLDCVNKYNTFRAEDSECVVFDIEKLFLPFVPEVHPVLEVPHCRRFPEISTRTHSREYSTLLFP